MPSSESGKQYVGSVASELPGSAPLAGGFTVEITGGFNCADAMIRCKGSLTILPPSLVYHYQCPFLHSERANVGIQATRLVAS
ncbi:MAG: hypothetical protein NVSMB64_25280 [Candidatus Velthaea sp.]